MNVLQYLEENKQEILHKAMEEKDKLGLDIISLFHMHHAQPNDKAALTFLEMTVEEYRAKQEQEL